MEARATVKFVRHTSRKINQILMLIRAKKVEVAFGILSFIHKSASLCVNKVLKSAVANAGKLENFSNLKIKSAWVGNGRTLKRMRAGPMGRSMPIKKRTSHLTIVVTDEN
ncbi:MAG: 50S ribosomal protein L22 [Endomicrobium sp.]|jgi:large subunit ribosomal protein L22|nr:50S ribosomal protein L22 [Endomicrobium sp.]